MLFLLIFTTAFAANLEFSDQNVALTLKPNRFSPSSCGIEFLEIGPDKKGKFEPQFSLFLDRYDSSFPGVQPKVRKIYSYFLPPHMKTVRKRNGKEEVTSKIVYEPPLVLDLDAPKRSILTKLTYDIVQSVAVTISAGLAAPASLTVDQIVRGYIQRREYHLHRALYAIKLLVESENSNLSKHIPKEELNRILAFGEERGIKGLLLNKDNVGAVTQHYEDQRYENRAKNFGNLLSVLNREGLDAQPLFRDFVVVYYDPKKEYAREIDLQYSDLEGSVEGKALRENSSWKKSGLIPLGIFSIGAASDRLLTVDFQSLDRMKDRKMVRYLSELGTQTGTTFIPFPFSLILTVTSEGAKWILNKAGNNILENTLQSEAELSQLLDSGFIEIDPNLLRDAKKNLDDQKINVFLDTSKSLAKNRVAHEKTFSQYLKSDSEKLCQSIESTREGEFREEFLSGGEKIGRGWKKIWNAVTGEESDYKQERKETIKERAPLINARNLLGSYYPSEFSLPSEILAPAILELGKWRENQDVPTLQRVLLENVDPEIENTIFSAMQIHKSGNLAKGLQEYIEENPQSATDAYIKTLLSLQYVKARNPDRAYIRAITSLRYIWENESYSKSFRKKAHDLWKKLRTEHTKWKSEHESGRDR